MGTRIHYREIDGYKYELAERFQLKTEICPVGRIPISTDYFALALDGLLTIEAGYAWDGPSGPAIDTKNFMRGSLVHDAFYQMIRLGLLLTTQRAAADLLLRELCREDGMSWARSTWVYLAVRTFAAPAATAEERLRAVLEAP